MVAGWIAGKFDLWSLNHLLMITATVVAGLPIARNAWIMLNSRIVGIEALVTIAAIGATFIGEYWEAAAVTFLFAFGGYLEARTLDKTRAAIKHLTDLVPLTAIVKKDGEETEVPAEDVAKGELVVVKPGSKIPVDGTIVKGYGTVNEAHITGEPIPVEKAVGDTVYSGTVNEVGFLEVETEKAGYDTTFARILELVEEAQESKAPTERFLTRFSKYYTPAIILLALMVYIFGKNIVMALTLLVIACPGALVIATPVSIVSAIGNGAKKGVLVKGGEHIEKAGKIDLVAFDKTGTLTYGKPALEEVIPFNRDRDEVLSLAARVEKNSEHHLAKAIREAAGDSGDAEDFTVYPGKGAGALVGDHLVRVGNRYLMADFEIPIPPEVEKALQTQENKGHTAVLVAEEEQVIGVIAVADQVREESAKVIAQLKGMGVKKVVMLTGDNHRTASSIAEELGIHEFKAGLLPEDKVNQIQSCKEEGYLVAMVGDGINDAPALAVADVGMAMGAAGTDAALEVADVILMSDRLPMVPYALGLSRATISNIKQNITIAIAVVLVLVAGVLGQKVFLASGMLAHEASIMVVILNAMRLMGFKPKIT